MTNTDDIRTTGPVGLKGLSEEQRRRIKESRDRAVSAFRNRYNPQLENTSEVQRYSPDEGMYNWGTSKYDSPIQPQYLTSGEMQDTRHENQPWYDTLANGVGKMLGTAGTTFVSSLVGLPAGIATAIGENRRSGLWDNDVTNGLAKVDDWLEKNMTNYKSQEQEQNKWWQNMGSMNWWADDVIKNAGFTLGAAASMAVGSGALGLMSKSLGFVKELGGVSKGASNFLSALFSATGEGMIEARQGVDDRNKLQIQKLRDSFTPQYAALEEQQKLIDEDYALTQDYDTYRQRSQDLLQQKALLDNQWNNGVQEIEESGRKMGNMILLGNQALLTMGNLIQFGKTMTKSFDRARHAAEVSKKTAKPSYWMSTNRVSDDIKEGYKLTGKWPGRIAAGTKGIVTEGSEEMNQQWIQNTAGNYYNREDVNDYWRAKLSPGATKDTVEGLHTFGQALSQGFQDSWGDPEQWEQFVIGGLTGMAGSYAPTKLFNQDKSKAWYDPRRYGEWSGGAYNEIKEFNTEYNKQQENVDDLNKILASEDFPSRVSSMIGHTYMEGIKTLAADDGNKKAWKDADDKQNIIDIQAFLRAGKLDDLRAIYQEMAGNLSDEDVENIRKSTTKEISAEEDQQNHDRLMDEEIATHQRKIDELNGRIQKIADDRDMLESPEEITAYNNSVQPAIESLLEEVDKEQDAIYKLEQDKASYVGQKKYDGAFVDDKGNNTATNDEIREEVKHNSEELNRKLDSYLESIDFVNRRTNGVLTKDQEDNLAYLHNMGKESNARMRKTMSKVRKSLPSKFLLKTTKTPEQLSKETASSDLAFSKDENTKEGYVEVDTSLMNDDSFADFFQREVLRGGNIRPEFAETAEEKAAREEEEKTLSEEERKKKAKERASKKWKDAVKKMEEDAKEQWTVNWGNLVDNFMENYRKDNNATLNETVEAFQQVRQDIQDASDLYDQAGEYYRTLDEYMKDPSKIDQDKEKEETKAQKAEEEKQTNNKFAGKDAKQMKEEVVGGVMDENEFFDFANMDLSGDAPQPIREAQQEAKKAQESMQKANALKNHVQNNLGDNPTAEELQVAEMTMKAIDDAMLNAESPEDISIDSPVLRDPPADMIDSSISMEDLDVITDTFQQQIADAFNAFKEDEDAQDDIPEKVPDGALEDVEPPTTGRDETTKTSAETVAPSVTSSKAAPEIVPKNPLTEDALDTIIQETINSTAINTNGTWRSTTMRYGKERRGESWVMTDKPYHELVADKNSPLYKRSKAIWEYLNSDAIKAFDRQENASKDRIKEKDTIHFMVKYMPEISGKEDFKDVPTDELLYSLVIFMVNDDGEIIGDLPLAQFEPSYRSGNPTDQVKGLLAFQEKVFDAFIKNKEKSPLNTAVVDNKQIDGTDNLNLTFDGGKKPLVTRVKQMMVGSVPYSKNERNTLNDVAEGQPLELAVKVTSGRAAVKREDKSPHNEIVMPKVGTTGQPYLLLPDASGKKVAVPFYMVPFDAQKHKNTELYKLLNNAVYHLLSGQSLPEEQKTKYFHKHIDVICGLLQLKRQQGIRVVDIKRDTITLHFESLTDPNQKIDISVQNRGATPVDVCAEIVSKLSGIPINVSLNYLNGKIETGIAQGEKYTKDYNQVIGEIADVNLPKGTHHTVNSWFTIETVSDKGIQPSEKLHVKTTGFTTEVIGGRSVEIDNDRLIARDPNTGEQISNNEEVNLRLAEIKANKPQYQGKDRIQISVDGEVRTYDTKNKKFVKNTPKSTITTTPNHPASSASSPAADELNMADVQAPSPGVRFGGEATAKQKLTEQRGKTSEPIDVLVAWAEGRISGEDAIKQLDGTEYVKHTKGNPGLGTKDSVHLSNRVEWVLGKYITEKYPFLTYGNVSVATGVSTFGGNMNLTVVRDTEGNEYGTPSNFLRSLATKPDGRAAEVVKKGLEASSAQSKGKSIEEIEENMKFNKIIGRQNKDSWDAIPNDLKLKIVNEGSAIQLSYKNNTVIVSLSDRENFIKELTKANIEAKKGNLTVSEAVKPMEKEGTSLSRENERVARRWLAKNLPSLNSEERVQFVNKLARMGNNAGKAWGSYRAGVIQIQRNAPMGTVYHEAFHYVMDMILSPEEQKEVLDIAMKEYGVSDVWTAGERLANDFRRYALDENATGIIGRIKRLIRKLRDRIMRYNRISDVTVNQLFWKINNGQLAQKSLQVENFKENQQRVLTEIRNVQQENYAWKNLDKSAKSTLKELGVTEDIYNNMSLEEKEQYIKCMV